MPTVELTPELVKTVTVSKGKRYEYYNDTKLPGLLLCVNSGGRKSYMIRIHIPRSGKKFSKTFASTEQISLSAARKFAKEYIAQIISGNNPFAKKGMLVASNLTLKTVYEKWNQWALENKKYRDCTKSSYYSLKDFYDKEIDKISNEDIQTWQQSELKRGIKSSTINRRYRELKFLAKWAIEHKLIESYQFKNSKLLSETDIEPKTHHFSDTERKAIIKAAKEQSMLSIGGRNMAYIYPLVIVLLKTGMRPASALGLIWDDVRFNESEIYIRAANIKTRNGMWIIMNETLKRVLETWKTKTTGVATDTVFPGDGTKRKDAKHQFKTVLKRAGLGNSKYSIYSCRHDAASEIIRNGGSITDVQFMLGHSSPRITAKYSHPDRERMAAVARKLDDKEI